MSPHAFSNCGPSLPWRPGFKKPEAQLEWLAQIERIATRLEANGFTGYTSGPAQTLI